MKTNQDGGSYSAKKSSAPAKELAANQKGAAKYGHHKGAADYSVKKGSHDHPHGAPKMGYKQSFGAGKANCYAKGAAKVAEIMTFGASKYGHHKGAADSGHGGPAGHTHPSMTTKSIETSGGGSSSSTSNTTGNKSAVKTEAKKKKTVSRETAYNNRGSQFKDMNRDQYNKEIDKYNENKKKKESNSTSSSSSSNNTNSGSTIRKSETITSKKSMGAVQEKGKIADENRASKNAYKREMTNIRAASDSISARNNFLNSKPAHLQNHPKVLNTAAAVGGVVAKKTRIKSGDFSFTEANKIQKEGRNSSGR